ncbi:12405_t:CDS:2 [Funneliformis caledonium]|uniref:12405_t:CDS:1 n=1 Tax=Funneliformis caledonium TaxID=1117310 RepID=A0A9N9EH34_9GLOM|nr:12405_t:CDS:2 [Funneliformis caledonium]
MKASYPLGSLQEENERLQSTVTFQQLSDKDSKIQELHAVNEELHNNFLQACLKTSVERLTFLYVSIVYIH